ncbi:hypothetical protein CYY_007920 [Polysphondylium violaceum]|uniref:PH domain-containing protein n=1 Tax=Polysphondylium violaceum TaxID=133409 RepID=A0A8J4V1T0_9MYCE|nr:hypothetical protein CYY_007920 [Polysphondylium violaceum]
MKKSSSQLNIGGASSNGEGSSIIAMDVSYDTLTEQIKKYGYLKKLGGKGISKNWRKRFFILTNSGILYYFKHRTSSEAVGAVDLAEYTKIYKDKTKKRNYFLLVNENKPEQRVFHLISESEQEMGSWISDITEFFEDDVSDLKNQLNMLSIQKREKIDTLKRNVIKSKRVEEYELDKVQLVFKGERLSLLFKNSPTTGSVNTNGNTLESTLLHSSSTPLDNNNSDNNITNNNGNDENDDLNIINYDDDVGGGDEDDEDDDN